MTGSFDPLANLGKSLIDQSDKRLVGSAFPLLHRALNYSKPVSDTKPATALFHTFLNVIYTIEDPIFLGEKLKILKTTPKNSSFGNIFGIFVKCYEGFKISSYYFN